MIKIGIDQTVDIEEYHSLVEYSVDKITETGQGMNRIIGMTRGRNFRGNVRMNQNNRRQIYRGGYRGNYRNEIYERGRSRSKERQYQSNFRRNDISSSSRSRSGSRVSTNRDRIRCYKCREYDHFAKDYHTSKIEKETDQMQQMFNLDEEQTSLKTLATDTYDSLNQVGSLEEIKSENLNLQRVRMVPPYFCL